MIGKAWLGLAAELEAELRQTDPRAVVRPKIDADGLLRLIVVSERADARPATRRYEARAASSCEACGGDLRTVRAGPVATFLCRTCKDG